jgi:hypothetical protein
MVADAGPGRLPILIATLLAAATVFFLWGALAERSRESHESAETTALETGNESESPSSEASEEGEHSETAAERVAEAGRNEGQSAEEHGEEEEFRPLGVNLESTPLLAAGAVLSLALAGLVAKRPRREVLLAVLILAAGFTALEIVEVQHQADVENTGILVLALIAGVLHAAAFLAALALMSSRRPGLRTPVG